MPKAPKTYDDLYDAGLSERDALTLAVVLPNLPSNERIIDLRGNSSTYAGKTRTFWETDEAERTEFTKRATPIVPGSSLYRVAPVLREKLDRDDEFVGYYPRPHGRRTYHIDRWDVVEFVPVDADDYEFADHPQATLDDFGGPSPHFNPWYANRDAFDRDPHLPV